MSSFRIYNKILSERTHNYVVVITLRIIATLMSLALTILLRNCGYLCKINAKNCEITNQKICNIIKGKKFFGYLSFSFMLSSSSNKIAFKASISSVTLKERTIEYNIVLRTLQLIRYCAITFHPPLNLTFSRKQIFLTRVSYFNF